MLCDFSKVWAPKMCMVRGMYVCICVSDRRCKEPEKCKAAGTFIVFVCMLSSINSQWNLWNKIVPQTSIYQMLQCVAPHQNVCCYITVDFFNLSAHSTAAETDFSDWKNDSSYLLLQFIILLFSPSHFMNKVGLSPSVSSSQNTESSVSVSMRKTEERETDGDGSRKD